MDVAKLVMDLEITLLRKVEAIEFSQLNKCRDS